MAPVDALKIRIKQQWEKLLALKDSPREVAIGAAVGVFFAFTPLVGLKTVLAAGITWLLGGSVVSAVVAVTLHDVLLPLMPLLMRWEYQVGYWMLSHPHAFPPSLHQALKGHPASWLKWSSFLTVGLPLLVGSLFVSGPLALLTFFGIGGVLDGFRKRRRASAKEIAAPPPPVEAPADKRTS